MVLTNFGEWSIMFVSLRRRELKFLSTWGGNGILCSSPCGDVSCNTESAFKEYLKEGVRSLAETWVEISFVENEVWFRWVRLLAETWVEMYRAILLALDRHSSSPQGDVNWNSTISCFSFQYTGSFPCGDVSWNDSRTFGTSRKYRVRLFTETWVEIEDKNLERAWYSCSSPYGDVNWNVNPNDAANSLYGSSPYGDVSWNKGHPPSGFSLSRSSPCGDVNWNRIAGYCWVFRKVRLLTETWVEMYGYYFYNCKF